MNRVRGILLLLLTALPLDGAWADELQQMPQYLTPPTVSAPVTPPVTPPVAPPATPPAKPSAAPTVKAPSSIPVMPQYLPQPQVQPQVQPRAQIGPGPEVEPEPFMMQCRTNRTEMIFMLNPEYGLVQNVSSFPRTTGVLYVSEMEYVLVFSSRDIDVTLEFVINRYTGRLSAVANGERVVSTGNCRKVRARALF
ncbi:hypothetical protein [Magnetovibrio blakemorei]|uniref:Secreted protein n=1 Tax=Magnetovibrio blakemorei TaxID=28181 RepID=A0A1E5Q748_9PROT|nr:hypothetical protein [Magnetovibrio blakemorei]OEJ66742.1 hypothetical protein BEN30_11745 [Magnetovibrio blakemorei]